MKSVQIHSYGGSDLLSYQETPLPVPGEHDVLIHVHAASINSTDVAFRTGYMSAYIPLTFPVVLGLDVAGTVEAVGSAVSNLKVGAAVYARTDLYRLGGYAEYVLVTANEVALKPPSLDFIQAAYIPHAAVTAWRSLIDTADLKAGQTGLISRGRRRGRIARGPIGQKPRGECHRHRFHRQPGVPQRTGGR